VGEGVVEMEPLLGCSIVTRILILLLLFVNN